MRDIFRPRNSPAREIYDAFQAEADHREGRTPGEWMEAEVEAVRRAAAAAARKIGVRAPSVAQVEGAAYKAMRHVDYGATWARSVSALLRRRPCEGRRAYARAAARVGDRLEARGERQPSQREGVLATVELEKLE